LSPIPDPRSTTLLLSRARVNLKTRWLALLDRISEGLGLELHHAHARVGRIDPHARVSPGCFALHWRTRVAAEDCNLQGVLDCIRSTLDAPCLEGPARSGVRLESVLHDTWERPIVDAFRGASFGDDRRVRMRPDLAPLGKQRAHLQRALALIRKSDPCLSSEVHAHLIDIRLFTGATSPGGSSAAAPGAVFMMRPRSGDAVLHYLDWVVHECAHMHLHALRTVDPLFWDDGSPISSPIRPDSRSANGLVHAVFVLFRLVRFFERLQHIEHGCDPLELARRLERHRGHLTEGVDTALQHVAFTPRGRGWFAHIHHHTAEGAIAC
jgi:hypothetical protein